MSANYTDGLLILHKGRVVYEKYSGCLDDIGKHAAMSMTKSLTGLLAEILVVEGDLDENAPVSEVVPELADMPIKFIHAPWKAPETVLAQSGVTLGKTYPNPIVVDKVEARAQEPKLNKAEYPEYQTYQHCPMKIG